MRQMRVVKVVGLISAMLFFAGCASTPMLVSEWSNPAYKSPYFKKIAVSCLDGHTSIRRNCEDEFVAQLRAAGIDALPSYRSFPEDAKLDETKVKQMAKEAGADGALIVRSVSVEQKTEISPYLLSDTRVRYFWPECFRHMVRLVWRAAGLSIRGVYVGSDS